MSDWINYGKTWNEFEEELDSLAGLLVEVLDYCPPNHTERPPREPSSSRLLVGNVNTEGGCCDCCYGWSERGKAVVLRYKRIWSPES